MIKQYLRGVAAASRSNVCHRFLHTGTVHDMSKKGLLGKLRKKTGFSISQCKKALDQFEYDISQAESWLKEQAQKEGWARATKLQGRAMSQGLVGLLVDKHAAAMVEVNCETDFVARIDKFQGLVSAAATACLHHSKSNASAVSKVSFNHETMSALEMSDGHTLADQVALMVGNIRENMAIRRGVVLSAPQGSHIGTYIHSAAAQGIKIGSCQMGRFGSLVIFTQQLQDSSSSSSSSSSDFCLLSPSDLGRQLGQHVVGMNPQKLGSLDSRPSENPDEETSLLHQEFLLESSLHVREFLEQNSASVSDFVRFECGEELAEEQS